MSPMIHFVYQPGFERTLENMFAIINKGGVEDMHLFQDKFTPPLVRNIKSKFDADSIKNVFAAVNWSNDDVNRFMGMLPTRKPAKNPYCTIVKLSHLIELMKKELKYIENGRHVLDPVVNLEVVHRHVDVKKGDYELSKIGDDVISPKTKKSVRYRKMEPMTIRNLYNLFVKHMGSAPVSFDALVTFLSLRRLWGIEASREYRQKDSVRMGIEAIRTQVFGLEHVELPADGNYSVSADWTKVDLEYEAPTFAEIMSKLLRFESPEDFMDKLEAYFHQKMDKDDTDSNCSEASNKGNDEEDNDKPKKKRKAKVDIAPKKPRGRPPKHPKRVQEQEQPKRPVKSVKAPRRVVGGKGIPEPVDDEREETRKKKREREEKQKELENKMDKELEEEVAQEAAKRAQAKRPKTKELEITQETQETTQETTQDSYKVDQKELEQREADRLALLASQQPTQPEDYEEEEQEEQNDENNDGSFKLV